MKPSFIIFVVVLIFIVLDLIEAFPSPQGKGNAPPPPPAKGKGNATPPPPAAKGKGNTPPPAAKGKNTAATAQTNNGAKGNGGANNGAKGNGGANNGAKNGANIGADTNAKNADASQSPPGASSQICKTDGVKPADGTQQKVENCVSTFMGEVPSVNNMVSSLIIAPSNGQTIKANSAFQLQVKVNNLNTGFFSNATSQYYTVSQQVDKNNGNIFGHAHFTVQTIDNANPPDPQKFLFFKGLNDPAKNNVLTADVVQNNAAKTPGLPAGQFRVCSMASSFTHQPVIMPVAQRGSQDDCIRIFVK
ncbi:putative ribosomal protein s17 protein [Gigaspora margarita]|uniref:Putative ribosomal protein s17 protein n=1 Tax=Gigaspora margarita TaxID=4874 RepID=A0A8H4A3Q8_GIGMA|nr:putative ribosomal protein s17 protein [Gigaspora margarita]